MSKQIEALKLALEAFDGWRKGFPDHWGDIDEYAVDAIREALAHAQEVREQPAQQEPVAWMWKDGTVTTDPDRADGTWTPLYTSPPASPSQSDIKPWVGLDDTDLAVCDTDGVRLARYWELVLREKNA